MVDPGLLGNLNMQTTKMMMKKLNIVATAGTLAFKLTNMQLEDDGVVDPPP
jgi:hypothetical protein